MTGSNDFQLQTYANQFIITTKKSEPDSDETYIKIRDIDLGATDVLTNNGFRLWAYLIRRGRKNNWRFALSLVDARKHGISKNTYRKGIKELRDKGFLTESSSNHFFFYLNPNTAEQDQAKEEVFNQTTYQQPIEAPDEIQTDVLCEESADTTKKQVVSIEDCFDRLRSLNKRAKKVGISTYTKEDIEDYDALSLSQLLDDFESEIGDAETETSADTEVFDLFDTAWIKDKDEEPDEPETISFLRDYRRAKAGHI